MPRVSWIASLALLCLPACHRGSPPEPTEASATSAAAPSAPSGPLAADGFSKNPSRAGEQMRDKGLGLPEISKLMHERPVTDPVPWKQLLDLMPKFSDWAAQGCGGDITLSEAQKTTRASCTYTQADQSEALRVILEFVDTAYVASAYAAYEGKRGVERQDQKGYVRQIEMQGSPGYEEWKEKGKQIVVVLLVHDRYLVKMQGTNLNPQLAREWVRTLDLKGLAALPQ